MERVKIHQHWREKCCLTETTWKKENYIYKVHLIEIHNKECQLQMATKKGSIVADTHRLYIKDGHR